MKGSLEIDETELPTIEAGRIAITSDGNHFTFLDHDDPGNQVTIEASQLLDIVRSSLAPVAQNHVVQPAAPERRAAFRIPVWQQSDFHVNLAIDGSHWAVTPLDMSMYGILIEAPSNIPEIQIDSEVLLTLQMGSETVDMLSIVRRRNGNRYGLQFPQSCAGSEVTPPHQLHAVVENLTNQAAPLHTPDS